jgi:hypothetical protein
MPATVTNKVLHVIKNSTSGGTETVTVKAYWSGTGVTFCSYMKKEQLRLLYIQMELDVVRLKCWSISQTTMHHN